MSTSTSLPTTSPGRGGGILRSDEVVLPRLLVAVGVAAVISAVVNSLLGLAATEAFDIPEEFEPLAAGSPAISSVVAAVGAGVVLAALARFTQRPIHWFWRVSIAFFVVSFLPLVMMLMQDPPDFPGTDGQSVSVLALMHVVAFLATVPVLARLARAK